MANNREASLMNGRATLVADASSTESSTQSSTRGGGLPGEEREAHFTQMNGSAKGVHNLVEEVEASVATLTHAAENVENAGLKLLLKVMATVRTAQVRRLRATAGLAAPEQSETDWARERTVADGMTDIQATMSVRREQRQHLALYELVQSEETLLATYDAVSRKLNLDRTQPSDLARVIEAQRAELATFHSRLSHLDEKEAPLIVARLFEQESAAQSAIDQLQMRWLARDQIDLLRVTHAPQRAVVAVTRPAGLRSTVMAGALTGGIIGAVVGLAAALYVWFMPDIPAWISVGPWVLFFGSLIPGAVMGAVFGWIIGQNRIEDDRNVTRSGLEEGEWLVAVYPSQEQVAVAEEVLQIHHARTLER